MVLAVSGLGFWFTAIAVQYRDVNYAMGFLVHLLMYAAPVIYPTSLLPVAIGYSTPSIRWSA